MNWRNTDISHNMTNTDISPSMLGVFLEADGHIYMFFLLFSVVGTWQSSVRALVAFYLLSRV